MVLAVVGIVAFSDASLLVDSVSTVNLEALPILSSNLTDSNSMIVERGESEASETSKGSAVELYLEHQKNIANASGWNEYIISITNPNEEDIRKTSYLEGTRYNWDATGCWVRDYDFDGKIVATLGDMTAHLGDTLQVTVPVQLKAMGERNFYIFKVWSEDE